MLFGPPDLPRYLDIVPPPAAVAPAPDLSGARFSVRLGAYRSRVKAEAAARSWRIGGQQPAPLRVAPVRVAGALWFRITAGPLSKTQADALCARARGRGDPCAIDGVDLPEAPAPEPEATAPEDASAGSPG